MKGINASYAGFKWCLVRQLNTNRQILQDRTPGFLLKLDLEFCADDIVLYCIVFKYLYSAPQQPQANRGAFGSISSKKRDKF